jgi:NADH-quinone oxidoreductase subunit G
LPRISGDGYSLDHLFMLAGPADFLSFQTMSNPAPATAAAPTAPPAAPELVNVQIDGVWLKFPKGTRMIEACKQAKREVPHYCYHPKLSSPGNCRMCLVEMGMPPRLAPGVEAEKDEFGFAKIGWMPRAVIACANTVAEGMGIRTQSKLTEDCRKGVMEFLLINHPLDCPICDQAGECRLQEFSVQHGRGISRFIENKVKKPKNQQIGPRITLDDERCIMCSRCIRFSEEVADDPVLGFTERGSYTTLAVHPGKELANNYSLNTVDICPVGALTSTDFRFQMRVWFLKEAESVCTKCARGCNITIGSRENQVYRQTPRDNDAVNSSWMCDQGRLDFHYLNSESRLTEPMIKEDGKHRVASWREALETAATKLKSVAPSEIAIIASGRMTNEELWLLKRLSKALGTTQLDFVPRIGEADNYLVTADKNPNSNGVKLVLGADGSQLAAIRSAVQAGTVKALIVWQENLLKEAGFSAGDLGKLDFLLAGHILANPTAEAAQVVLPLAASAEKRGSMVNATGRLQRLQAAVQPPGQAQDDWEVLRDLTLAVSGQNGLYSLEDVVKQMTADVSAFSGLNLGKIGPQGVAVLETRETIPLLQREANRKKQGIIVG